MSGDINAIDIAIKNLPKPASTSPTVGTTSTNLAASFSAASGIPTKG